MGFAQLPPRAGGGALRAGNSGASGPWGQRALYDPLDQTQHRRGRVLLWIKCSLLPRQYQHRSAARNQCHRKRLEGHGCHYIRTYHLPRWRDFAGNSSRSNPDQRRGRGVLGRYWRGLRESIWRVVLLHQPEHFNGHRRQQHLCGRHHRRFSNDQPRSPRSDPPEPARTDAGSCPDPGPLAPSARYGPPARDCTGAQPGPSTGPDPWGSAWEGPSPGPRASPWWCSGPWPCCCPCLACCQANHGWRPCCAASPTGPSNGTGDHIPARWSGSALKRPTTDPTGHGKRAWEAGAQA